MKLKEQWADLKDKIDWTSLITKRISPLFVLSRQSISSSMTEPHLSCVNALLLGTIRIFKIGDDDPEGRSRADFALHGYGPANGLEKII